MKNNKISLRHSSEHSLAELFYSLGEFLIDDTMETNIRTVALTSVSRRIHCPRPTQKNNNKKL